MKSKVAGYPKYICPGKEGPYSDKRKKKKRKDPSGVSPRQLLTVSVVVSPPPTPSEECPRPSGRGHRRGLGRKPYLSLVPSRGLGDFTGSCPTDYRGPVGVTEHSCFLHLFLRR